MNNIPILASAPHRAAPAEASCRHDRPATPRSVVATWRWRMRFRWELDQKSKDDPRLIDDICLTTRQVETEIAKPFWQR